MRWPGRSGQLGRGGHFFSEPGLRAFDRRVETLAANGLQEIVHRVHIKGAHGVLVVCGDKDDWNVRTDQFQDVESRQFGHLHVEKNQIGFVLGDGLYGFHAIRAFGGDVNLRMEFQKFPNYVAREFFIIHDQCFPAFVSRGAHAFSSLSAGRDKLT